MNGREFYYSEHLHTELDKIYAYPLTIVTAAVGFGKSVVVRTYLESRNSRYLWININDCNETHDYVWNSLIAQISLFDYKFGEELDRIGYPRDILQRNHFFVILGRYMYNKKCVLVIDNYERIIGDEMDNLIEGFIQFGVSGIHLVIISSCRPKLHVEELCLKGLCYEITQEKFALTEDEIEQYFQLNNCKLQKKFYKEIYRLSEGWPIGILLLFNNYKKYEAIKFDDEIDIVIEELVIKPATCYTNKIMELLFKFGPGTLDFLISITQYDDGKNICRDVIENCGFIILENDGISYRLQRMIHRYYARNLLCDDELQSSRKLYTRVGDWYIRKKNIQMGIYYYRKACNYQKILKEYGKRKSIVLMESDPDGTVDIFHNMPEVYKYKYPIAYLNYIVFYLTHIDMKKGTKMLHDFECDLNTKMSCNKSVRHKVTCELEMAKFHLEFNNVDAMIKQISHAKKLLAGTSMIVGQDELCSCGSPHLSYLYYNCLGQYLKITKLLLENFKLYELITGGCGAGFANLFHAEYLHETGQYELSSFECEKGRFFAEKNNQRDLVICSKFLEARNCFATGKIEEGLHIAEQFYTSRKRIDNPILTDTREIALGYIGYISADNRFVRRLTTSQMINGFSVLYEGIGFAYITCAMSILMKEEYRRLEAYILEIMPTFKRFNNIMGYIHGFILDAIAKNHLLDYTVAEGSLVKALNYARVDHVVQPFIEHYRKLKPILETYFSRHSEDRFVEEILNMMHPYRQFMDNLSIHRVDKLRFTPREFEVLNLIVKGKNNREIAADLYLAEITVKKHISSIYNKLGVHRRSLAIQKSIELNLF